MRAVKLDRVGTMVKPRAARVDYPPWFCFITLSWVAGRVSTNAAERHLMMLLLLFYGSHRTHSLRLVAERPRCVTSLRDVGRILTLSADDRGEECPR